MIDHILGRPSTQFRKAQVLAVLTFWSLYLLKSVAYPFFCSSAECSAECVLTSSRGNNHGPPRIRKLSRALSRLITPWQTVVATLLYLYTARNFDSLLGLESPEPLASLYSRSYFRATWVTTALDAGFWTAMRIRRKWLRDLCSIVFTIYYLIAAERADEKVRKVRGMLTLDHLRVSWNKGTTPYLGFLSALMRPRLMTFPPRAISISRPSSSDYKEPVHAWLYFNGPLSALKDQSKIVLDIPGGGFVAMDPRTNDDKLFAWAGHTGLPVLSVDYKKAPEYPYPYSLNECYDVYHTIIESRGRCIGLSGNAVPKVVITGDSAGGNLATGTMLKILEAPASKRPESRVHLPIPEGLILIYPGLDFNIVNWMSEEHMSLFKDRRMGKTNRNMLRQKDMQYAKLAGTPNQSDDEDVPVSPPSSPPSSTQPRPGAAGSVTPSSSPALARTPGNRVPTRLALTSMISYFNDRVLTPEMMRAMILLYIGPYNRPIFSEDYYLSPILAPSSLLARFPKTYLLTGERDPLVDDTIIFAGRLRRAKAEMYELANRRAEGLGREFNDRDVVEVSLIPGISHGFLQFAGVFPEGREHILQCGRWIDEIFQNSNSNRESGSTAAPVAESKPSGGSHSNKRGEGRGRAERRRQSRSLDQSSDDEALEMQKSPPTGKSKARPAAKTREDGLGEIPGKDAKKQERETKASPSKGLNSLASEDDIIGRRMLVLAGGLAGEGNGNSEKGS